LAPVRDAELERRREVVARLSEIAQGDDLRGAADLAKRAQAEWTPLVRAARKVEQALWTDFRAACDQIFERLRERRERQQGERDAALLDAQAACKRIEQVATQLEALGFRAEDKETESSLTAEFGEAQRAYADAGEVPRARESELRSAYRKACDRVDAAKRSRRRSRQLQGLSGLAERAALAERLEQAVLAGDVEAASAAADAAIGAWDGLAPTEDKALGEVVKRYQRALAAAQGDGEATKALQASTGKTLSDREELALALEIATGTESPPAYQQARMAYQVNLLQASMTGADRKSASEIEQMLRRWYTLGPVAPEHANALSERFEKVHAAALNAKRK
ncbi:MAG: DUF349 domain-containing protein, partial [Pseudomonadota bacterium]